MKQKAADVIGSIFLIALSAAGLVECRAFPDSASVLPTFTLGGILLLSVLQILSLRRAPEEKVEINLKRVTVIIAALLIYVTLLRVVGYYFCTLLFIGGLMASFGIRKVKTLIAVPVLFCVFVYVVFAKGLSISLPGGLLF